jgi:predicted RNA-binding protein with PUA-like domain
MAYWLFKEEPNHYSFADLERDGTTLWDGVSNNLALKNLRQVRSGDRVLYYHTGSERAVVGEMVVLGDPKPDLQRRDPKTIVVEVRPVRRLHQPVTLDQIKKEKHLAEWDLVRLPRLSIVPVSESQWHRVQKLSNPTGKK